MNITEKTIDYYNTNAKKFVATTAFVDFQSTQDRFCGKLAPNACILDFGCGSGRDTKYFLEQGFQVCAIDGSKELCKIASAYTGIHVRHMLFQEMHETNTYDGIWACSSILHLPKHELHTVTDHLISALRQNGIIYTSFKYGSFEGMRNGRYFTDFTETSFETFIADFSNIHIEELWVTADVRAGRGDEKWLNLILRKN